MEKIEKYVVFKYEDEFGFHYMKMDKLPGEGPTYIEPLREVYARVSPSRRSIFIAQGGSTSSSSKHFSLKGLKKFQHLGKIDYIWAKQHGQHNDYQSQRTN